MVLWAEILLLDQILTHQQLQVGTVALDFLPSVLLLHHLRAILMDLATQSQI